MKKVISLGFLLLIVTMTYACDVCSCSVGGNYFGILPQFRRHFAGMRYQFRSFESFHPGESEAASNERFQTLELWGRYVPHPRVQLFAFVPVQYFQQNSTEGDVVSKGLGDISLMANYILFNTGDSSRYSWKHALQAGGGVKLPTGRSTLLSEGLLINQNLQPGTGSVDIPLSVIYTLRYKQAGLNTELGYRINTANASGYRFGNRSFASCRLFYWQKAGQFAFLPQAGISLEYSEADKKSGIQQHYTGGTAVTGSIGADIYYQRFSIGASWQHLLHQDMGDGNIIGKQRFNTHLIYLF